MESEKDSTALDWKNVLPAIYQDLAQPSAKKIGKALSSVVGLVFTPLGSAASIAERNLEKLTEKLDKIPSEKIQPVLPEIGMPILEKMKCTRGDELVNLYTELFVTAANSDSQDQAHPSYFHVISNLSVDEAKIIEYLSTMEIGVIPFFRIKMQQKLGNVILRKHLTNLSKHITFYKESNEAMCIENLMRLGILIDDNRSLNKEEGYNEILETTSFKAMKKAIIERKDNSEFAYQKGYLVVSIFGSQFIKTCIPGAKIIVGQVIEDSQLA